MKKKVEGNSFVPSISPKILYPLFALHSILFYFLVICGSEIYAEISYAIQNIFSTNASVSGNAMDRFPIICAVILIVISIILAIKYSKKISYSNLIAGMIVSFLIFIILPLFYRTGGGFIDFGVVLDIVILCFAFWFLPGIFFILSFIVKKISKIKNNKDVVCK